MAALAALPIEQPIHIVGSRQRSVRIASSPKPMLIFVPARFP